MTGVQRKISPGGFEGVRADIQIGHGGRPTARSVDGKATGKTESVQHAPSFGQNFHFVPVLALVQKETRLLPAQNVCLKSHAVLRKNHRTIRSVAEQDLSIAPLK